MTGTTDEARLLGAAIADFEDDTVWLVYADSLQENGQEERAEFIRKWFVNSRRVRWSDVPFESTLTYLIDTKATFEQRSKSRFGLGSTLHVHPRDIEIILRSEVRAAVRSSYGTAVRALPNGDIEASEYPSFTLGQLFRLFGLPNVVHNHLFVPGVAIWDPSPRKAAT